MGPHPILAQGAQLAQRVGVKSADVRMLPLLLGSLALEPLVSSIIRGLFSERRLPPGSILDVGANEGHESRAYANECLRNNASSCLVHAIDPSPANIQYMIEKHHPIVHPLLGAIGDGTEGNISISQKQGRETGSMMSLDKNKTYPRSSRRRGERTIRVPMYTVDGLFESQWLGETLGFWHLDVEGHELPALRGAARVLARDRPMLVTEVWLHRGNDKPQQLIQHLSDSGYQSFLIEETCGMRMDCRNLLNIHVSRISEMLGSPTLDLATAARTLFPVDAASIDQHAFPCCKPKGECCKEPTDWRTCCTPTIVERWMDARKVTRHNPHAADIRTALIWNSNSEGHNGTHPGHAFPKARHPALFSFRHFHDGPESWQPLALTADAPPDQPLAQPAEPLAQPAEPLAQPDLGASAPGVAARIREWALEKKA